MLCFQRSPKVDGTTVVMTRDQAGQSRDTVLPLTLDNLTWNRDRLSEREEHVKKFIVNKRDSNWYRPLPVYLNKTSYPTIRQYLRDQDSLRQYTVGEMDECLGEENSDRRLETRMAWLVAMFDHAWVTNLKVVKPFQLSYSQVLEAAAPPSGGGLEYVANLLGAKLTPRDRHEYSEAPGPGHVVGGSVRCSRGLWSKLLFDTCFVYTGENSYIQLMQQGEEWVQDEPVACRPKRPLTCPDWPPRQVTDVKRLSFWENHMKHKLETQLRNERSTRESSHNTLPHGRQSDVVLDQDSQTGDVCGVIEADYGTSLTELVEAGDQEGSSGDAPRDKTKKKKKKKKKGVVRRMTAPLRWLRKKF